MLERALQEEHGDSVEPGVVLLDRARQLRGIRLGAPPVTVINALLVGLLIRPTQEPFPSA